MKTASVENPFRKVNLEVCGREWEKIRGWRIWNEKGLLGAERVGWLAGSVRGAWDS